MGDRTQVSYGVEWNSGTVVAGTECGFKQIVTEEAVAGRFRDTMRAFGHSEIFAWGNANAWASDFEHPELSPPTREDDGSLFWVDNVNLMYFAGHGGNAGEDGWVSFASNHNGTCRAHYPKMRLGVKQLRWLIIDACEAVMDPGDSVMRVWSGPSDGDSQHFRRSLHLVCAVIGDGFASVDTEGRGADFATSVSLGTPVGNAWLDAAFARSGSAVSAPIAIAFGRDQADAVTRRDHGRLADRDLGSVEANWLAWKWRS
jgi:hypothetical protein